MQGLHRTHDNTTCPTCAYGCTGLPVRAQNRPAETHPKTARNEHRGRIERPSERSPPEPEAPPATRRPRTGREHDARGSSGHPAPTSPGEGNNSEKPDDEPGRRAPRHETPGTKLGGRPQRFQNKLIPPLISTSGWTGSVRPISSRLLRTPSLPRMWAACVRTVSTPSCRACAILA